jgi:hypothetical protein
MKYLFGIVVLIIAVVAVTGKYVETQLAPPENYGWQPPAPDEIHDIYGNDEPQDLRIAAPHLFEDSK